MSVDITVEQIRVADIPTDNPLDLEGTLEYTTEIISESDGDGIVTPPDFDFFGPTLFGTTSGETFSLSLNVAGSATDGFAAAFGFGDIFLFYINNSLTDFIEVDVLFDYEITADAGITGPNDDALAFSGVFADSISGELLVLIVDELVESDALFGPFGPQSMSDSIGHTIVIPPESEGDLVAFLDVDGFAEAEAIIPEPAIIMLVGLGLAGLSFSRYSRQKNA